MVGVGVVVAVGVGVVAVIVKVFGRNRRIPTPIRALHPIIVRVLCQTTEQDLMRKLDVGSNFVLG